MVNWNTRPQTASASVSIDVGGMPGVGVLNGAAWHDADFDGVQDGGERALAGWIVELYRQRRAAAVGGRPMATASTGSAASRRTPTTGDRYELRFRAPDAGVGTALARPRRLARSRTACSGSRDIVVPSGSNLQNLNLPIDPNGVVYGAIDARAGRRRDAAHARPRAAARRCRRSASTIRCSRARSRARDGFYKFDLNFSDAAARAAAAT